jgi:hypothetical protein
MRFTKGCHKRIHLPAASGLLGASVSEFSIEDTGMEQINIKNGTMYIQAEAEKELKVLRIGAYDGGWLVSIPASNAVEFYSNFQNSDKSSERKGGFFIVEGNHSDKKSVVLTIGHADLMLSMTDANSILEFINRASNTIWNV